MLTGVTPQSCLALDFRHSFSSQLIHPSDQDEVAGVTTLILGTCLRGEQTSCSQPAPTSRCQDESSGNLTSGALHEACSHAVPPESYRRLGWLKHCHNQPQLQTVDISFEFRGKYSGKIHLKRESVKRIQAQL